MTDQMLSAPEYASATLAPSPNFGPRPDGQQAHLLILHYTGMPDDDQALSWLRNPASQVSCHYYVHQDGQILQLVSEGDRAWHAGVSSWQGITDINSCSIGIEIANPGHNYGYHAFPDIQVEAVKDLCQEIIRRHNIRAEHVLAHSDIAPDRKEDPGELFPWSYFAENGIGHYSAPKSLGDGRFFQLGDAGEPVAALQAMFQLYGYGCPQSGHFCELTCAVVRAFQRHFRPELVDGIADQSTIATLHELLMALQAPS
ncbi:MAG: N-acetylmuramoyl-L-alanine amidase [Alphaproteobacteria bacterium]|nr:N-acetylmuramoyl-L-alanine amidase [Alphaproteobacteria bacterium]